MLTKESIIQLLKTDKRAVARALVVLHNRQTNDEQAQEGTRYLNGRGFRPCHARMGSSMAKQFTRLGFLSEKQIAYWRVTDRSGSMRIGIYWAQLLEEAEQKAKALAPDGYKLHNFGPRGTTTPAEAVEIGKARLPDLNGPAFTAAALRMQNAERDFGNDMERKMILEEQLGDVMDSDDESIINPIAKEIDEIDAFWNKIRNGK